MNWFQIVFLREDSQALLDKPSSATCCELISNCIFTWGFTRSNAEIDAAPELWIDFKLYFYVRIHKYNVSAEFNGSVVNWFQIVFLREDSQDNHRAELYSLSCELISNCIFTWGFTSEFNSNGTGYMLWIDFKLYFYVRIHKLSLFLYVCLYVVNWFQIVFLREDSQGAIKKARLLMRCELISNCIFTWGFTS